MQKINGISVTRVTSFNEKCHKRVLKMALQLGPFFSDQLKGGHPRVCLSPQNPKLR